RRLGLLKWFNLRSDLAFELPIPIITSVSRYEQPRAEINYYKFDWVRVTTSDSKLLGGEFLLAVGNFGMSMGKVRSGTADLYEAIRTSTVSARQTTTGAP